MYISQFYISINLVVRSKIEKAVKKSATG